MMMSAQEEIQLSEDYIDTWWSESARSVNTCQDASEQIPNSPILINYHELDSIEVNMGQIHDELR